MATLGNYIHYHYENYQKYGITQKGKNNNNGMTILQAQKNAMIAKAKVSKNSANTQKLQQALQGMLYPKTERDAQSQIRMQQYLENSISDILSKWVVQWDGLNFQGTSKKLDSFKFGETKGYYLSNITKLLNQAKSLQTSLSSGNVNQDFIAKLDNLIILAQQAQNNAETFLKQSGGNFVSYTKIANPIQKKDYINTIKQLNSVLTTLSTATYQEALGTAFEHAIGTLDDRLNNTVDAVSTELLKNTIVTGAHSEQVQINGLDSHMKNLSASLKVNAPDISININAQGNTTTLNTVFKADVNLQYNNEKYRISAKNYNLKDPRISIVSNISLLTGLMRNISPEAINHALNMTVSHGVTKTIQEQANDAIKMILAVEALTGISQTKGSADTLIINNRSAKKVLVKPVAELITPELINICSFSGYTLDKKGEIYNQWMSSKNKANDWLAGKIRIDKLLKILHQQKLHISLNTRSLF